MLPPDAVVRPFYIGVNETATSAASRCGMEKHSFLVLNKLHAYRETLAVGLQASCVKARPTQGRELREFFGGSMEHHEHVARGLINDLMRPSVTCSRLARHGASGDGGYVMCEDVDFVRMAPPAGCLVYSFGIKDQFVFENQAVSRGCTVHGYDPTVGGGGGKQFHFHSVGLGGHSSKTGGFLSGVGKVQSYGELSASNGHAGRNISLFKMDIEGSEWAAMDAMSDSELSSFSQVIVELHLNEASAMAMPPGKWLAKFAPTIRRLRSFFDLYHAHANNCGGSRLIGAVRVPLVWELSLVRRGLLPPSRALAASSNVAGDKLDMPVCGMNAFTRQWVKHDLECSCASRSPQSCECREHFIPFVDHVL